MSALEEWLMLLLLEHNVNMLRVEAEAKARVLSLLILMQKDVVSILANAPAMSELGKLGKNTILRESNAVIAEYYGKAALQVDLFGIAEVESMGVKRALETVLERAAGPASVEIRLGLGLPTENYLQKLASDVLIQGSPAKSWWLRQQQDTQFKLANEIRIGAAQGETNAQIIKRIVGQDATVAKAPSAPGAVPVIEPSIPGVMPLARKNAAAIVQTSMATVAAEARRATFKANRDITNGIIQISTLDGHTSLTCIAYSGATWDLDYEPIGENDLPYNGGVPRHWNCRSSEASIMKTPREMGIDMDEPDPGMRASSNGPISAKTTFVEFLKMKGADYQNEVLGPGRAELFRQGKLTPRDLVDMRGNPLKLEQLRENYGRTFNAPSGQFTIYDPGFKRVAPDISTPGRAAAVRFEEAIRRNDRETGAFFKADGSLLVARTGLPDQVRFSAADLAGTKGTLFTHNHPSGGSFSVSDIQNGSGLKLAEVRAVAPDYRHIVSPSGAWPSEYAIKRAFDAEASAAYREVDRMVRAGELSVKYASTEIQHLQWVIASEKLGLKYIREGS